MRSLAGVRFAGGAVTGADVLDGRTGAAERMVAAWCWPAGHSARDTPEAVHAAGVTMEQKPFSVGGIGAFPGGGERAQCRRHAHPALGPPTTSCPRTPERARRPHVLPCPGGEACAASEEGGVVNGMSRFSRADGSNANAALLGAWVPRTSGATILAGAAELQRCMEQAAYRAAIAQAAPVYQAPAQTVEISGRSRRRREREGAADGRARRGLVRPAECLPGFVRRHRRGPAPCSIVGCAGCGRGCGDDRRGDAQLEPRAHRARRRRAAGGRRPTTRPKAASTLRRGRGQPAAS